MRKRASGATVVAIADLPAQPVITQNLRCYRSMDVSEVKKLKVPVSIRSHRPLILDVRALRDPLGSWGHHELAIILQELRSKLEELGLDSTGLKQALVERLEAALSKSEGGAAPAATATADTILPAPELDAAPSEAEVLPC